MKKCLLAIFVGPILIQFAVAQHAESAAKSGFSFAVYGDSRSMMCESPNNSAFGYGNEFFAREFWRFVLVQQYVGKMALTAVDYPPMQDPATFNLDAIKAKISELMKAHEDQ